MPTPKRLGDRVYLCPLIVTMHDDDRPDAPTVEVTADVIDERLQITRISFEATAREIQRADLRAISLEEIRETLAADFGMRADSRSGTASLVLKTDGTQEPDPSGNRQNARSVDYSRLVEVYNEAESAPVKAVADAFGRSHRWASMHVAKAEERGLLMRRPGSGAR